MADKIFDEKVFDVEYTMRFQDGGLSANSPLMIGFIETTRLWPESDIVILSVGTGVLEPQAKGIFTHDGGEPHIGRVMKSMFGAKDVQGLLDANALSRSKHCPLHFQRMNPQVPIKSENGRDLLNMADYRSMEDWKRIGQEYAKSHQHELESWAKFLAEKNKKY